MKRLSFIALIAVIVFSSAFAQKPALKLAEPVLLTSCGQSPGHLKIKVYFTKLKMNFTYSLQATAADLVSKKNEGKPFKSVIIVVGASLKGMGAARVSIDDEIERTKKLMAEAKQQGIKVVGAHVEGVARRAQGASPGDNTDELTIDAICPQSDMLLIRNDGNADKRFTTISKSRKIPMVTFEKNMELADVLKSLYEK